ncbi:TIGR03758 family integrating conjugative element protein [Rouxiella badensis]|uniref:TIGR03758 family integrating conjugative element protein n=1 Tax=Rouxiella badensis TaxID=1646377 RepID=UPI001D157E45|nr:TIGR03758 family integrating conjugative element protein [Rouxiella badensis]MCC3701661.1 TIGR03758 family integrating conjugative element protein [Rouxiella badensis]
MNDAQNQAFKAASGGLDSHVMYLLCMGLLVGILFLWAAWGISDVWQGWAETKVKEKAMVRWLLRAVLLIVMSLWMFSS